MRLRRPIVSGPGSPDTGVAGGDMSHQCHVSFVTVPRLLTFLKRGLTWLVGLDSSTVCRVSKEKDGGVGTMSNMRGLVERGIHRLFQLPTKYSYILEVR